MDLNNKYKSLIDREFKKDIDIYITLNKCGLLEIKNFEDFIKTDNLNMEAIRKEYIRLYQTNKDKITINGKDIDIKKLDNALSEWYESSEYMEFKNKYKSVYENHFREKVLKIDFLENIFKGANKNPICYYCGIEEKVIEKMLRHNKFNTIRFYYNRGRGLEIDRKDPLIGYKENNIVLCCYWCNNAKTDEFDDKEFKAIGSVIGLIWEKRNPDKQT